MFYNFMEAGNLFVLNLILVRGTKTEIRRAVGWLALATIADTAYSVTFQYSVGRELHNPEPFDSAFFVGTLFYLIAAMYFLWGSTAQQEEPRPATLLGMINPLPFCVVLGVGALLIVSAFHNMASSVTILSVGIVVIAVLLLLRVVVSARESLSLAQEKHAIEQQLQAQRVGLIMRFSGGVSHVINNLMAVVLGNADLLRAAAAKGGPDAEKLDALILAARSASKLAARLALCSGSRIHGESPRRLAEAVVSREEPVKRLLGSKRDVVFEVDESQGNALVAPTDVEAILNELVSNAGEATYHAGRITIRMADVPLPPELVADASGELWSMLEVSDTGRGIEKDALPHLIEPFFTSRPFVEGRGLGLSMVNGIVSRYGGHLTIDSEPESGSRVRVYLPIKADERA
jgi:signal transduction histidine kinase